MNTLSASQMSRRQAAGVPLSTTPVAEDCTAASKGKPRIALFGHFGQGNFGNDGTLQVVVHHLRRLAPGAEFTCICTGPDAVAAAYGIGAVSNRVPAANTQTRNSPLARFARRLVVGVPRELGEWTRSLKTLWGTDALVVPGTGLLHDAYTFFSWGPYDMFRWLVAAKLCRCRILFVSVGAGPLYSRAGRFFVKTALSLADYRSYRDEATRRYLEGIGFRAGKDPVYPDLVFSLSESVIPHNHGSSDHRPVVGLGLMKYAGKYSVERPAGATYSAYLEVFADFAEWLLAHKYDVRLIIGDVVDRPVAQEFRSLLKERSATYDQDRIVDEPIESIEDLLEQLERTDVVVATRFHNVLLALLLEKPVVAISFHQKSVSLMEQMGLSEYCQDIGDLSVDRMIEQFLRVQQGGDSMKAMIGERVGACRVALDEQYAIMLRKICPSGDLPHPR
jgi:polysaccharide pyruvyl transferase WcaK-like protein